MHSNSIARHISPMFYAKSLLPRLDKLLPVRSCLQNFYQCGGVSNWDMWLIETCFCSWLYDRYSSQQDLCTITLELAGKLPSFFRKFSHVFVKVSLRSFWSSSHRRGCSYKCTFHGMRCSKDIFSPMWIFSYGVAGYKSHKPRTFSLYINLQINVGTYIWMPVCLTASSTGMPTFY